MIKINLPYDKNFMEEITNQVWFYQDDFVLKTYFYYFSTTHVKGFFIQDSENLGMLLYICHNMTKSIEIIQYFDYSQELENI